MENGACGRRRGNVCGIQLLPGVGSREPTFYPAQVPTAGRDSGFKMGDREENRCGSKPQLRDHGWQSIRTPFLPLNSLKELNLKLSMCWLVFIYFAFPFQYCDTMNRSVLKRELQVLPARSALRAGGFSDVHCMCQVLDKIDGVISTGRRFLHSSQWIDSFNSCILL